MVMKSMHHSDVIMSTMASQITTLMIVYSTVYSGPDQRKQQSSASLAFVMEIHQWQVNSPFKGRVTRKMFPFDDVIMVFYTQYVCMIWICAEKCVICRNEFIRFLKNIREYISSIHPQQSNTYLVIYIYIYIYIYICACHLNNMLHV